MEKLYHYLVPINSGGRRTYLSTASAMTLPRKQKSTMVHYSTKTSNTKQESELRLYFLFERCFIHYFQHSDSRIIIFLYSKYQPGFVLAYFCPVLMYYNKSNELQVAVSSIAFFLGRRRIQEVAL